MEKHGWVRFLVSLPSTYDYVSVGSEPSLSRQLVITSLNSKVFSSPHCSFPRSKYITPFLKNN